jgi:hypothetical protein
VLTALATKLDPAAAADLAKGLAAALENPQDTDLDRLSSFGDVLMALANELDPPAAMGIARQTALSLVAALRNQKNEDSDRLLKWGKSLAALCTLLPSAHRTQLLALSNMLLRPISEVPKEASDLKEQPANPQLLTKVCAQLPTEELAEALKYPFSTGEAEQIVLAELKQKTGRDFSGDVWKFVEQADALGIKDIGGPAHRPSAKDALEELNKL